MLQVYSDAVVNPTNSRYFVKSFDLITSPSNSTRSNNEPVLGVGIKYSDLQHATITCFEEPSADQKQKVPEARCLAVVLGHCTQCSPYTTQHATAGCRVLRAASSTAKPHSHRRGAYRMTKLSYKA
jgi:hypothetical protein